ncbi:cytochrome P450 [Aspergillus sclerotioniger CBS 115572]|uniref:Cytochrome P450 n=1 Tax=Aspergillus sclerotioniger CBS 115572 TaxID=1450535 RepID=A0A317VP16_9EURO|nr:cytochrome P450 [Aspergillus sclerotioniger CBS 115572]PWY76114.1 cytochrome P450 [Aspergillus sclerotioniger CBS 115572]
MVLQGTLPWVSAEPFLTFKIIATVTLITVAVLAISYLILTSRNTPLLSKKHHLAPPQLLWPVHKIAQSFFDTQFDFLAEGFRTTASRVFRFRLFQNEVIAVSGEDARRTFFREKALNLYEGFQVLIGTIPTGLDPHALSFIYKRLSVLQRPDNLQFLLPRLLSDCHRKMDLWGKEGLLDPTSTVHEVTFQMIIRAVTSFDVAENPALVSRLKYFYDIIDASVKPMASRFSWVPGLAMLRKLWASMSVYRIFASALDERKRSGVSRPDALQQLLDSGESSNCIVGFMMGLPIAGARSTGTIGTWLLLFLSHEQEWFAAVRKEIQTLITTYISDPPSSISGQSIVDLLSRIPLSAWESSTPTLDLCIRETLRRAQPHTAVRKNTGPDLTIGSYTIPSGSFVLYPFSDTLLNPSIYSDPFRWNPARSLAKEDQFIGWGGGTHMCKGQRLANLTMKLVVAYASIRYDMDLVDQRGQPISGPPVPDWNDFLTCRPKNDCTIKFSERPEWTL